MRPPRDLPIGRPLVVIAVLLLVFVVIPRQSIPSTESHLNAAGLSLDAVLGTPTYTSSHEIDALFRTLRQGLLAHQPDDPLTLLQAALANVSRPRIVIMGPPASGKGTQCELLVRSFGFVHISTGDLLRKEVAQGTDLGKKAQEFMSSGKLVPDSLVVSLMKKRISEEDVEGKGWLLDGFPRTVPQLRIMEEENIVPTGVVVLDVPDEVVTERVGGRRMDPKTGFSYHLKYKPPPPDIKERLVQRSDDTEEKIKERLKHYHASASSLISSFSSPVHSIEAGSLPPNEIFSKITKALQRSRWASLAAKMGLCRENNTRAEASCNM